MPRAPRGGVVPPAGSDVTIDVPASNPKILFTSAAAAVQINSLTTSELMTISEGTLQGATTLRAPTRRRCMQTP